MNRPSRAGAPELSSQTTFVSLKGGTVPSSLIRAELSGKDTLNSKANVTFAHQVLPTTSMIDTILLCDPLTGLVAYPSFESYLVRHLPLLITRSVHLAIGDVDDLRSYVLAARRGDPLMFGHIAGNTCMQVIGATVRKWALEVMQEWPLLICATFGGDEVIVAGSGLPYHQFSDGVTALSEQIKSSAPRPCSFACASLDPTTIENYDSNRAYRYFISTVDRALFDFKDHCKSLRSATNVMDLGRVSLWDLYSGDQEISK